MKRTLLYLTVLTLIVLFASCKGEPKQKSSENGDEPDINTSDNSSMSITFKDSDSEIIFKQYLRLKEALFNSDVSEARQAAKEMADKNFDFAPNVKNIATEIAAMEDIAMQRKTFAQMTEQLETVFNGSLESGKIYKQYCPMAFGDTGGYWLSDSKAITNPYLGEKMPHCGSLQGSIK